jgi:prolyl 4-hydroxylase
MRGSSIFLLLATTVLLGFFFLPSLSELGAHQENPSSFPSALSHAAVVGGKPLRTVREPFVREEISTAPRLVVYRNFLTPDEAAAIVAAGADAVTPSLVVQNGKNVPNPDRSSSGTFLRASSPIIRGIKERVARASMLPVENQEQMYLLRYAEGQQYKTHPDYFNVQQPATLRMMNNQGGQRIATAFFMLSPAEEGGATAFPRVDKEVHLRAGDMAFWYDTLPTGEGDAMSHHAGMPVTKGVKWASTIWIRTHEFGTTVRPDD